MSTKKGKRLKNDKRNEEEEVPKALRKDKKIREDEIQNKNKKRKKPKKGKHPKLKKTIIIIIIIIIIILAVSLGISSHRWKTLAQEMLINEHGEKSGSALTVISFFGGMLLIALIDKLIPSEENPHEVKLVEEEHKPPTKKLMRMGVFTALAIAIHNFPEGLATFVSALQDPGIAIPIVVAIAIHNIPEGIAVSVPIYQATGSKIKAFKYSFLSGLAEPAGALIGWLVLMPFMNDTIFGIIFAGVAGIMVFISFDELLPAAREYGEHHLSLYGLISGMIVMAVSLLLFI